MSSRLRPPEPPSGPFNIPSPTARKNVRSAIPIPTGTVASRVYHLQSLSRATATHDLPSDSGSHPGESPLGPVKRSNNPFAAIFWRKALPDNVQEVEIAHSSPESTTSRDDEDVQDPNHPSTDLQNVLRTDQQTLDNTKRRIRKRERPAHPPVPKRRSSSGTIRGHNAQRFDGTQEEKELLERLQGHLRGVPGPSRAVQRPQRSPPQRPPPQRPPPQRPPPQRPENFRSESSNTTTSTIRRQSVRELFQDNGIERPAGLASPNNSEDTGKAPHSSKAHVSCHRCSFNNKFVQIACRKCGHHFCDHCPASSIFPHDPFSHKPVSPLSSQKCPEDSNGQDKTPHPSPSTSDPQNSKPHTVALRRPKNKNSQVQGLKPTIRLSSFSRTDSFNMSQSEKYKRHPLSDAEPYESTRMKFKDIPRSTMNETSSTFPHQQSAGVSNSMRRPGGSWKPSQEQQAPSDTSSEVSHVNNSMSHDTSDGQSSSPAPITHEHQTVAQGEADLLAAPTECHAESQSNEADTPDQKTNSYFPNLSSFTQRESAHSPLSRTPSGPHHEAAASNTNQQPEYVQCNGFPRTGLGGGGTPVQPGMIGECQHYLDDCDCLACQRTHSAVRCCISKDHPSIPHIHQVPQAASRFEQNAVLSPIVLTSEIRQLEGQNSPRRSKGRMTPTFKYPVTNVDTVQKKVGKKQASSAHAMNGILKGGLSHPDTASNNRGSSAMAFNEFLGSSQSEILAVQPHSRNPVLYSPIPTRHASLLSKTIIMPSQGSLRLQAKQGEQKREGSQLGQKELDNKSESAKRRLAKAERKYLKQAARLEKKEGKMNSNKGDNAPEDRSLVLSYELGHRAKQIQRQSSHHGAESRSGRETPTQNLRDRINNRSSSLGTSRSKGLDYHINVGKRDNLQAKSNASGILGITVIVHMSNAEDLVFKVDASMAESKREW